MDTDVLFIDGVSIVSTTIMGSVEYLCRHTRGGNCFGGMQVIFCGDFYQLPPIKDPKYGDDGS